MFVSSYPVSSGHYFLRTIAYKSKQAPNEDYPFLGVKADFVPYCDSVADLDSVMRWNICANALNKII